MSGTRDAVEELLARYARCFDAHDIDGLRDCFTADARLEVGDAVEARGRDAVLDELRRRRERHTDAGRLPWHVVSGVEVAELDADSLHVRSRYMLLLVEPGRAPALAAVGSYEDELARGRDGWRIARRRVLAP